MNENRPDQPEQASGQEEQEIVVSEASPASEEVVVPVETIESEESTGGDENRDTFLYRHPEDKIVGGICGGLGDYFGIDPILVRIMWVVLTLGTAGTGLLAYAALWLLLPVGTAKAGQHAPAALELNERNVGRAGLLLVAFGVIWLLANLGDTAGLVARILAGDGPGFLAGTFDGGRAALAEEPAGLAQPFLQRAQKDAREEIAGSVALEPRVGQEWSTPPPRRAFR